MFPGFTRKFYRTPHGDCLFHVQVAKFQAAYSIKNYFTGAFQDFFYKSEKSQFEGVHLIKIPENYL